MVCSGEYLQKKTMTKHGVTHYMSDMVLEVELTTFEYKHIFWSINTTKQAFSSRTNRAKTIKEIDSQAQMENEDAEKQALKDVKKLLDAYPLDLTAAEASQIDIDKVLEYRNYLTKLPIFIKLIDFTDHGKI